MLGASLGLGVKKSKQASLVMRDLPVVKMEAIDLRC